MENLLTDQLNVLKTMILNVEDKLGSQEDHYKKQFRRIQAMLMRGRPGAVLTPAVVVPSSSSVSTSTQTAGSSSVASSSLFGSGAVASTNSVGTQATFGKLINVHSSLPFSFQIYQQLTGFCKEIEFVRMYSSYEQFFYV